MPPLPISPRAKLEAAKWGRGAAPALARAPLLTLGRFPTRQGGRIASHATPAAYKQGWWGVTVAWAFARADHTTPSP